jgi:hypothetical protein
MLDLFDESIDALEELPICALPTEIFSQACSEKISFTQLTPAPCPLGFQFRYGFQEPSRILGST